MVCKKEPRDFEESDYAKAIQYEIMAGDAFIKKSLANRYYKTAISLLKNIKGENLDAARANHLLGHIYANKKFSGYSLKLALKHYKVALDLGIGDAADCIGRLKS